MQKTGQNMRLICMSSMDDPSKEPHCCDTSCQVNSESLKELPDLEMKVRLWQARSSRTAKYCVATTDDGSDTDKNNG